MNYWKKFNSSVKIIHKRSKYESNDAIRLLSDYEQIEKRFDYLNLNIYLKKSLSNKNQLIEELHKGYQQYSESMSLKITTLFCEYRNLV